MQSNRPTVLALVAVCLAVIGAPCPWLQIPITRMTGGPLGEFMQNSVFEGAAAFQPTLTVTAFNGTITVAGIETPTWLLVVMALIAAGLVLLRVHKRVDVPQLAVLGLFAVSTLGLLFAGAAGLSGGGASLGIGVPLLLAANGVGIWAAATSLLAPDSGRPRAA